MTNERSGDLAREVSECRPPRRRDITCSDGSAAISGPRGTVIGREDCETLVVTDS